MEGKVYKLVCTGCGTVLVVSRNKVRVEILASWKTCPKCQRYAQNKIEEAENE